MFYIFVSLVTLSLSVCWYIIFKHIFLIVFHLNKLVLYATHETFSFRIECSWSTLNISLINLSCTSLEVCYFLFISFHFKWHIIFSIQIKWCVAFIRFIVYHEFGCFLLFLNFRLPGCLPPFRPARINLPTDWWFHILAFVSSFNIYLYITFKSIFVLLATPNENWCTEIAQDFITFYAFEVNLEIYMVSLT